MSVLTLACVGGSEDIVDYLMKTNEIDVSCGPSVSYVLMVICQILLNDSIVLFRSWSCLWCWQLKDNRGSVWI